MNNYIQNKEKISLFKRHFISLFFYLIFGFGVHRYWFPKVIFTPLVLNSTLGFTNF